MNTPTLFTPWSWFREEDESFAPRSSQWLRPALRVQRAFGRALEELYRELPGANLSLFEPGGEQDGGEQSFLIPELNIAEGIDAYTLEADIPGVEKENLTVTVRQGRLTIEGERRSSHGERHDRHYHRLERRYGSFRRVLSLPEDADDQAVKASFKNGVLTLEIKKKVGDQSQARTIKIQ